MKKIKSNGWLGAASSWTGSQPHREQASAALAAGAEWERAERQRMRMTSLSIGLPQKRADRRVTFYFVYR